MRGDRDDVFVVGDPLQAIYGWNGADPALFRSLPDALRQPTVLALPSNYRCTPEVLEVAQHVLANSGAADDGARALRSRRTSGLPVEFVEVDDDIDEVAVARRIVEQHVRSGIDPSVAVLARTHQLLEPVKTSLTAAGIPVASRRASTMRANAIDEVAECRTRHDLTVWAADVIVESTDEDEHIVRSEEHTSELQSH